MLIRFNVTNFLSFQEETEFNMLAGSPRSKKEHVYHQKGIDFMRAAALYGANGAGKSNLIKAIAFLQGLVKGSKASQYNKYFKLDPEYKNKPSVFEIEFIEKDILFAYNISILNDIILEESLYEVTGGEEDKLLFERKENVEVGERIRMSKDYRRTPKEKLLIELYAEKLLKKNELFLTKIKEDEVYLDNDKLLTAYTWFENLFIIYPHTRFNTGLFNDPVVNNAFKFTQKIISNLDTGITALDFEEFSMEDFLGEDDKETQHILKERLKEEPYLNIENHEGKNYTVIKKNGNIVICRMVARHENYTKNRIVFEIEEESDGTQRLLDLLPGIFGAKEYPRVCIIDEINRSVHPTLTKELIKLFMDTKETKGQLIFSTHESQLLDLNIFRQDEIWFTEKNKSGATQLYPLSDFKVRPDLVLKKGYLNGRFGAIPFLGNLKELNWKGATENG